MQTDQQVPDRMLLKFVIVMLLIVLVNYVDCRGMDNYEDDQGISSDPGDFDFYSDSYAESGQTRNNLLPILDLVLKGVNTGTSLYQAIAGNGKGGSSGKQVDVRDGVAIEGTGNNAQTGEIYNNSGGSMNVKSNITINGVSNASQSSSSKRQMSRRMLRDRRDQYPCEEQRSPLDDRRHKFRIV